MQAVLRISGLPVAALDAAAAFHGDHLPRARAELAGEAAEIVGQDVQGDPGLIQPERAASDKLSDSNQRSDQDEREGGAPNPERGLLSCRCWLDSGRARHGNCRRSGGCEHASE